MMIWGWREKRRRRSLRTGDGDNLYFSGSNPARFVRFCCRYKPGIMGQSLPLTIYDLTLVGFALADNLCYQVLFQKRALRTDMGPGNESHFFAPTLIGLADFLSATNSETAHPPQRHQASTITGTTTEVLGCILQLAQVGKPQRGRLRCALLHSATSPCASSLLNMHPSPSFRCVVLPGCMLAQA